MSLVSHALATLAEVKEELNVAGTARDSMVEECVNRATGVVEAFLDREIMARSVGTVVATVTEYYSLSTPLESFYLSQFPAASLTSVQELETWPSTYGSALSGSTDYMADLKRGRLTRISSAGVSYWKTGLRGIKVVWAPGYSSLADVPYSIRDVARRLASLYYREIDRAQQGISAYSDAMGNVTRFGPARLTAEMQEQLYPHRRFYRTDQVLIERA